MEYAKVDVVVGIDGDEDDKVVFGPTRKYFFAMQPYILLNTGMDDVPNSDNGVDGGDIWIRVIGVVVGAIVCGIIGGVIGDVLKVVV